MNEEDILKEFGNNLRAERNRLGLSQEELADLTGLSYGQVIGTIERGEVNTSLLSVIYILKALNITFEKLFDINKIEK